MFSQIFYLARSKVDGSYLVAHLQPEVARNTEAPPTQRYLLLFREHFDALSYLNTHAQGLADRFAIESITANQIDHLLKRWDFSGIGVVRDPLIPQVEFLAHQ